MVARHLRIALGWQGLQLLPHEGAQHVANPLLFGFVQAQPQR